MAKQDTFTGAEWTLLRVTPSFVSVGVSVADPSGLFSSLKEVIAGANDMIDTLNANRGLELFAALAADRSIPGIPDIEKLLGEGARHQRMQNFKNLALESVKTAAELVARKASAPEADAYRKLLVSVAQKAADAAKEGGFLGFGGVRVSDRERAFISEVCRAAGID